MAGCAASNRFRLLRRDCERQRLKPSKPSRFFCCLSADSEYSVLHATFRILLLTAVLKKEIGRLPTSTEIVWVCNGKVRRKRPRE